MSETKFNYIGVGDIGNYYGGLYIMEKLNLLLMFNQGTNVCFSTKAPLLQNRCYVPFLSQKL
jgi:hypothetical protein